MNASSMPGIATWLAYPVEDAGSGRSFSAGELTELMKGAGPKSS
ncbi:MAG: hypothetical protein SGJ09_12910 [Phycisphaerae bacterium]|nr:hypothetical protein [Phycisphaerae bacterium]